ncbi:Rne/Rng family ribonuclease [Compostibacter hankyongensis]|uniref:Rne/Rng family ribonuclease n=1 Tax=Compostibacter hankyongensis TaxID=1007089 RepID=A0ABP8FDP9_9BACT
MNKELIINAHHGNVELALLEDKKLVELHHESSNTRFAVGDLYLGKVKKLIPGLNAAFVDVGYERDAFLHYTDLSPYARSILRFTQLAINNKSPEGFDFSRFRNEPEIVKTGKITEVLNGRPNVLVQILKEPISTKGPRLSCEISLPGRFVVLTPFNDIIAVSKKIHSSDERKRLQKIVEAIRPKNFGVIVRTAAEGKNTAELHDDLRTLVEMWKTMQRNLRGATPPQKILSERDRTTSILRDLLNASFNRIVVNDKNLYNDARSYIQKIAPDKQDIVSHYTGSAPVFDAFGITKQIKSSFGKTVNLDSGVYLIIEPTEALHVIDVNSGYKSASSNQEQNAVGANLEAAAEIARQLRLRDLGGIIIIDFIDMKQAEHKRAVYEAMQRYMANDRARHTILPISKFGVMQITRQRVRPEVNISTSEQCPTCRGTGKIGSSVLLTDEIEKNLQYLLKNRHSGLTLQVNPILYAFLKKGVYNQQWKWYFRYRQWINIRPDPSCQLVEYRFLDKNGEEIKLAGA